MGMFSAGLVRLYLVGFRARLSHAPDEARQHGYKAVHFYRMLLEAILTGEETLTIPTTPRIIKVGRHEFIVTVTDHKLACLDHHRFMRGLYSSTGVNGDGSAFWTWNHPELIGEHYTVARLRETGEEFDRRMTSDENSNEGAPAVIMADVLRKLGCVIPS